MHWNSFKCLLVSAALLATTAITHAADALLNVLVWDEQQPEQKQAYGDKFLGETIAAQLSAKKGLKVKSVRLEDPSQGLDDATLNGADVLIWWGHRRHGEVSDANVDRIAARVKEGKLAVIALHSAHWSKPFVRLMQERAKDDALKQVPAVERATVKFELSNEKPQGRLPKRDAELTPNLKRVDGTWKLTLPGCIFPLVRNKAEPSHLATEQPNHPISKGIAAKWDIPQTEVYGGVFHVPKPDAVLFNERWDDGETFTSGCLWKVGKGQVFYFRPGHETYPIFKQEEPMRIVENAVRWMGKEVRSGKPKK